MRHSSPNRPPKKNTINEVLDFLRSRSPKITQKIKNDTF